MKTKIIPATSELLLRYYGKQPPKTSYSFVAVKDNRVIGVSGVYITKSRLIVFASISDELKDDKRTIVKGIAKVMKLAKEKHLPIYAICDESIEKAVNFIKHVGFVHEYEGVYVWHG